MLKVDLNNIVRQSLRIILLIFHAIILIHLFYEIIYSIQEETNKELFNSIQCGLTAVVSFLSFALYVWYYDGIRFSWSKLRKIDNSLKMIGVKLQPESKPFSPPTQVCVSVTLILVYFYSKHLRNLYQAPGLSLILILRNAFTRTYFVTMNGFVMLTFMNDVHAGKRRFQALNRYVNRWIDKNKNVLYVQDVDHINGLYLEIIDYCDSIRNSYQIQIFLTSISDMFTVIYMLLTVFNEFVSKPAATAGIIYCIVDPLYRIVQTVVVISTVVAATRQARQMADCLQRLMIEIKLDSTIKEKLRLFLMEMVDKKLMFIVSGFVTLNYETLVAMLGTISTYLLIMMQFRPPGDTEEDDNNSLPRENRLLH